jgi:polar amino acid transport system permease protein
MSGFEWSWPFVAEILPQLLMAARWTVLAAISSFAIALILGVVLAVSSDSTHRLLSWPTRLAVDFIRGTPLLIQIYFLYFLLPSFGIVLPALTVGILALSVHYAAYSCDAYRAGFASIGQGQHEAAQALGLHAGVIFFKIMLPQALRPIIPILGNYFLFLIKETPLLSAVAIVELLQTAKLIGSTSFRYTEPITIAGLVFLALSLLASAGARWVERRMKRAPW